MDEQQMHQSWLLRLQLMNQENAILKTQLAYQLQALSHKDFLDHAEQFQTQLLDKDAAISLLRHELSLPPNKGWRTAISTHKQADWQYDPMEKNLQAMEEDQLNLKRRFACFVRAASTNNPSLLLPGSMAQQITDIPSDLRDE